MLRISCSIEKGPDTDAPVSKVLGFLVPTAVDFRLLFPAGLPNPFRGPPWSLMLPPPVKEIRNKSP